jgi:hypothetical protein
VSVRGADSGQGSGDFVEDLGLRQINTNYNYFSLKSGDS